MDVDTRRGMEEGVPALLTLLDELGVRATFFLSFGPDNSGKAVYRMVSNPRFLFKMVRTNAPGLYGFRVITSYSIHYTKLYDPYRAVRKP